MNRSGVLVVSASTGTGHLRAGEALCEAFAGRDPSERVEHVDLLAIAPRWVRALYGTGFERMVEHAPWVWGQIYRHTDGRGQDPARWAPLAESLLFREFRRLLAAAPWRLVVCTHFLPSQLARRRPGRPPFAIAVTDFALHRVWAQPGIDRYFVATEALARELGRRVRGAEVRATGIPVAGRFSRAPGRDAARRELGLDPARPTVVVMGGGLGLGVEATATAAVGAEVRGVQVVAVCGRNEEARARLTALDLPPARLKVVGYVPDVERYLAAADLVVTKPGGLTASEALALGRPLLLAGPIPGHERANQDALVREGAAAAAAAPEEVRGEVGRCFGEPGRLRSLARHAARLGRPDAAATIAALCAPAPELAAAG